MRTFIGNTRTSHIQRSEREIMGFRLNYLHNFTTFLFDGPNTVALLYSSLVMSSSFIEIGLLCAPGWCHTRHSTKSRKLRFASAIHSLGQRHGSRTEETILIRFSDQHCYRVDMCTFIPLKIQLWFLCIAFVHRFVRPAKERDGNTFLTRWGRPKYRLGFLLMQ